MTGKRKYDDLIQKDIEAVQHLLQLESAGRVKCRKTDRGGNDKIDEQQLLKSKDDLKAIFSATCLFEQGGSPFGPRDLNDTTPVPEADLRKVITEFVEFYERLDTIDVINRKPNYSYTELIFLALMRSPNYCLPIHEIYRYIRSRFSFFRRFKKEHWKSAVRHSLSKTRCFTKIGDKHLKQQSGSLKRLCYLWTIVPKSLSNFARGAYRACVDRDSRVNVLKWAFHEVNAVNFWNKCSDAMKVVVDNLKYQMEESDDVADIFQKQMCNWPATISHDRSTGFLEHRPDESLYKYCTPFQLREEAQESVDSKWRDASENLLDISQSSGDCPSPRESDSDTSWASSPQDSGHETLGELSSPEELYRQFNAYQYHHENVEAHQSVSVSEITNLSSLNNTSAYSYFPLPDISQESLNVIPAIPHLPPLTLPSNGEIEAGSVTFSGYLSNDVTHPETYQQHSGTSSCVYDTKEQPALKSPLFPENNDSFDMAEHLFVYL